MFRMLKTFIFLKGSKIVEEVFYPYDADHPQHHIAKKQMSAGGGIISFTVKGGRVVPSNL